MTVEPDPIREAIQEFLEDALGDDWHVSHYVVAIGLDKIANGELQTSHWWYAPDSQADYVTTGLLVAVDEMREEAEGQYNKASD